MLDLRIIWNMKTERESELNDVILAPVFGKAQGGV